MQHYTLKEHRQQEITYEENDDMVIHQQLIKYMSNIYFIFLNNKNNLFDLESWINHNSKICRFSPLI